MRPSLLKNYGPTQIFQERKTSLHEITNQVQRDQKSKSVHTFGVEYRDFYDQLRLQGKKCKPQKYEHKPIFKLTGDSIEVVKKKERELYPVDIHWNNCQYGRPQGEIGNAVKNYAKVLNNKQEIRRYLEGSSSVIDPSENKTYSQFNSYQSIAKQERFSNEVATKVSVNSKKQWSTYTPDWIQRGKY